MKRIEVRLSLEVVAPLLDVIKAASVSLVDHLAAPNIFSDIEPDFRAEWRRDLLAAQNAEVERLLALFDSEFFSSGVIAFDRENAEPIGRACAAVRLWLRTRHLTGLEEDLLESGDVEVEALLEPSRKAFMCYLFLATIQELIIQHLDSSILES
ncbi:MAG: hypothetical protein HS122_00550 [Opitutaceae bacterium]|nr:hypothetical protein [Opitutaceae bacterium]